MVLEIQVCHYELSKNKQFKEPGLEIVVVELSLCLVNSHQGERSLESNFVFEKGSVIEKYNL